MPQQIQPLYLDGVQEINELSSYWKKDGFVYYFHGAFPIFNHSEGDLNSFRLITSQMVDNGVCRNKDIKKAFGVTKLSVSRASKKLRDHGPKGFFEKRRVRGGSVMNEKVLKDAQECLDEGLSRRQTAEKLDINKETLVKAIQAGKLHEVKKKASFRQTHTIKATAISKTVKLKWGLQHRGTLRGELRLWAVQQRRLLTLKVADL